MLGRPAIQRLKQLPQRKGGTTSAHCFNFANTDYRLAKAWVWDIDIRALVKRATEIILTNVETGEVEVHRDENLITNALDKIINIEMAMNHQPNSRILPIATNLLGGIMLFDGELQESADNIHFPSDVHLVGYAGQQVNTTDKYRGSYNAIESGKTGTDFVSVWDFGTTQANGTIKAVARTHAYGGQCPIYYYCGPEYEQTISGNPTNDTFLGDCQAVLRQGRSVHQDHGSQRADLHGSPHGHDLDHPAGLMKKRA